MHSQRAPARTGARCSDDAESVKRYRRALSLWQDGEFDLCLRDLAPIADDRGTPESIFLRCRALIRSGRPGEARESLSACAHRLIGADEQATHAMLTGTALAQCGDLEDAQPYFDYARSLAPHHTIAAENDYQHAFACYQLGEMAKARGLLTQALRPVEDIVCARAQSLLGWIDVAASKYVSALLHFKSSLETLARCSAKDTQLQARTVCAIATAEAELHAQDPVRLEADASKVRWTVNLVCEHVQTLRHIGLAHQRQGNHSGALARFIAGAEVAPGTAWAVLCYADCAGNAFCCGELEHAYGFAATSSALAQRITWEMISGEARLALLALAQVSARLGDAVSAQAYRDVYHRQPGVPSTNALRHDARLETYERHVDGDIALALGDSVRASALLSSARSGWKNLHYRWRAAEAEAALGRLGMDRSAFDGPAGRDRRHAIPIGAQLSARDHGILRDVVAGQCDRNIADDFNIAPRTAKNIINGMYKQFGVHKRVELIAVALREDPTLIVPVE